MTAPEATCWCWTAAVCAAGDWTGVVWVSDGRVGGGPVKPADDPERRIVVTNDNNVLFERRFVVLLLLLLLIQIKNTEVNCFPRRR